MASLLQSLLPPPPPAGASLLTIAPPPPPPLPTLLPAAGSSKPLQSLTDAILNRGALRPVPEEESHYARVTRKSQDQVKLGRGRLCTPLIKSPAYLYCVG